MLLAVADEPVMDTFFTPLCRTRGSPASPPRPETMLSTPGGSTSARSSPRRSTETQACSAGFTTTVLPAASAKPALAEHIATGAFHGMIAPTTPYGSRLVNPIVDGSRTTLWPRAASRVICATRFQNQAMPGPARPLLSSINRPLSWVSR